MGRLHRAWAGLAFVLATGCPSLDGFTGRELTDAGTPDSPTESGPPDSGPAGKGYLSLDDAARFCTYVFTCPKLPDTINDSLSVPIDVHSYSACIDELASPLPSNHPGTLAQSKQLACGALATNCAEANACLGVEDISAGDPRCQATEAGTGAACSPDGRSVYRCDANFVLHCDNAFYHPGSTCSPVSTDAGMEYWCAVAQACTGDPTCSGSIESFCDALGETVSLDCAVKGQNCGVDVNSSLFGCILGDTVPTCTVRGTTCNGDKIHICDGFGFSEIDCAALGGVCSVQPSPHCAKSSDACNQTDANLNACTGDSISLCVAGAPEALDCTSLGMKCVAASGSQSAHCQ